MKLEILFIGVDGKKVVSLKETLKQIEKAKTYELALETEQGEKVEWIHLDDPDEFRTLFQFIVADRRSRVDKKIFMADRPSFCVLTIWNNQIVRLEFYEGHDALSLVYDIRSKELQGKKLPNFMDEDPQAYDPAKFLKETFGFPEEFTKPLKSLLDELHKEK
ncbi:MAG: hypothetical protein AB1472_03810 [Candidatus Omnitrophota bacterium]